MEAMASEALASGFVTAIRNSRGWHWRGASGDQERELAAEYRTLAAGHHFSHPFVGAVLERIAESYAREAEWEDDRARMESRLND